MAANATAVWRVRPSGNNNNGGGYDPGIAGAGTDFSQQNAAQVTQSGGTVSTATVTLTDTGAAFTTSLIGNAIRVAGTGISTTYTFITARPSATTLTLQTSPGTTGTSVTYNIGGGWADFWTNTTSSGPLVVNNTVFILGSGIPNPAAYTYDYSPGARFAPPNGSSAGRITFANDPATPGYKAPPDTTGGMPVTKLPADLFFNAPSLIELSGLYFVAQSGGGNVGSVFFQPNNCTAFGCVNDQFSFDTYFTGGGSGQMFLIGCEVFSSAGGSGGSNSALSIGNFSIVHACNIHDTVGPGISNGGFGTVIKDCVIAKCHGDAIGLADPSGIARAQNYIVNNTIDANTGNGIVINTADALAITNILNNIISNHTGGGKFGLTIGAGTAAANSSYASFVDYNTYYNNTSNYNAINAGPHDTALGVTPYVAQATENYTLV